MLQIEDDVDNREGEEHSEDATQLDFDQLEELERNKQANLYSTAKRSRIEVDTNSTITNKRMTTEQNRSVSNNNNNNRQSMTSSPSTVLISSNELTYIRTIGSGSCGEVYEADYKGTRVAVKKIYRSLLHGDSIKEIQMETEILRRLRHPSIVLFMGTSIQGKEMSIITEYIELGSLRDVLNNFNNCKFDWKTMLSMAIDAAKGMNYLHTYNPMIIHRDLKSYNLLVDRNFRIKVTDFGLAKFQGEDKATTFCGTLPWTSPEILKGTGYSEKCDVYSFAIVLWELLTKEEPYLNLNKPDIIVGVTQNKLRPPIPTNCPITFSQLLSDSWNDNPSLRPSFNEILHRLHQLYSIANNNNNNSNSNFNSFNNNNIENSSSNGLVTPMNLTEEFKNNHNNTNNKVNKWEIDTKEIEITKEIKEGTISTLYKGIYKNKEVAIKIIKEGVVDNKQIEEFKKQIEFYNDIRCKSIVNFIGVSLYPKLAIINEYLPYGSIFDIMNNNNNNNNNNIKYDWELVIKLAIGAAEAMATIHNNRPPLLHKYLTPTNLLVDSSLNVKVTDLAISRFITNENNTNVNKIKGSYIYASPEVFNNLQYTTKSDCFSFGIILWELTHRCIAGTYLKPYYEHKNLKYDFQIIIQTAKHNLRPSIHSTCPPPFADIMHKCWDPIPDNRISFDQILSQLQAIKVLFEQEQRRRLM